MIDQRRGVDQHAVHLAGERRLGQPRPNAGGHVGDGDRLAEVLLTAVGQE